MEHLTIFSFFIFINKNYIEKKKTEIMIKGLRAGIRHQAPLSCACRPLFNPPVLKMCVHAILEMRVELCSLNCVEPSPNRGEKKKHFYYISSHRKNREKNRIFSPRVLFGRDSLSLKFHSI